MEDFQRKISLFKQNFFPQKNKISDKLKFRGGSNYPLLFPSTTRLANVACDVCNAAVDGA